MLSRSLERTLHEMRKPERDICRLISLFTYAYPKPSTEPKAVPLGIKLT